VRLAEVDVAQGGGQLVVAQQPLHGGQVTAGLQQVGGVAVPQRVQAGLLGDATGHEEAAEQPLYRAVVQGLAPVPAGEQPAVGAVAPPGVAQQPQQGGRQGDQAVLAALGTAEVDDQAGAVDVRHAQAEDLAQAQAAAVGGLHQHQEPGEVDGGEEASDLVGAEHTGQGAWLLAVGDHRHQAGPAQGHLVQEAQGADGLVEATPGGALFDQVQLVEAEVLGVEVLRGAAEVAGEEGDAADVGLDGAGAVVAALQVLGQALAQRGHGRLPWGRVHTPAADVAATMPGRASQRKTSFRKGQRQRRGAEAGPVRGVRLPPRSGLVQQWC
jgi:hypothetical protein